MNFLKLILCGPKDESPPKQQKRLRNQKIKSSYDLPGYEKRIARPTPILVPLQRKASQHQQDQVHTSKEPVLAQHFQVQLHAHIYEHQNLNNVLSGLEPNSQHLVLDLSHASTPFAFSFVVRNNHITHPHGQSASTIHSIFCSQLAQKHKTDICLLITDQPDGVCQKQFLNKNMNPTTGMVLSHKRILVPLQMTRARGITSWTEPSDNSNGRDRSSHRMLHRVYSQAVIRRSSQHIQSFNFSKPTQLRLDFFDYILVLPSGDKQSENQQQSLNASVKQWLTKTLSSLHKLSVLQKIEIVLPAGTQLCEITELFKEFFAQKLRDQNLQMVSSVINMQLKCHYLDLDLVRLTLQRRQEQENLLTLIMLVCQLFLIQCDEKSQRFVTTLVGRMRKMQFLDYVALKKEALQNKNSKRILVKIIRDHKLLAEESASQATVTEFVSAFQDFTRVRQESDNKCLWKVVFTEQQRVRIKTLMDFERCFSKNDQSFEAEQQSDRPEHSEGISPIAIFPNSEQEQTVNCQDMSYKTLSLKIQLDDDELQLADVGQECAQSEALNTQGDSPLKLHRSRTATEKWA